MAEDDLNLKIMKRVLLPLAFSVLGIAVLVPGSLAQNSPDLAKASDPTIWRIQNRSSTTVSKAGRMGMHLDAKPDDGFAWLVGSDFSSGTIEADLRGSNSPGSSFIGIVFHEIDPATYEKVYFRPFNFRNIDDSRRAHSVQYTSVPDFPWEKLRAETPGKYEHLIIPPPDPDDWFHVRIVVDGRIIRVFVNSSPTPSLEIESLSHRNGGLVGLWVGNNSSGDFANLIITPSK